MLRPTSVSENSSRGNTAYGESEQSKLSLLSYNYDKESIYSKEEIEIFIIANDIKDKIRTYINRYKNALVKKVEDEPSL